MADEYIKREDAVQKLLNTFAFHSYAGEMAASAISDIPAADVVERKTGHWINKAYGYGECSECGFCVGNFYVSDFCPKCGAGMRGNSDAAD